MEDAFKKFGLYNIDVDYLSVLYESDNEVRYSSDLSYDNKPYVGVVVMVEGYNYFIPLTSAKPKHIKWKNVSQTHYLVYERVSVDEIRDNDVVKCLENEYLKILSALEIHKMIPAPEDCFKRIDFNKIQDVRYKALLIKEFLFLQNVQDGICKKAKAIYDKQIKTGRVFERYCNFKLLEKICDSWNR